MYSKVKNLVAEKTKHQRKSEKPQRDIQEAQTVSYLVKQLLLSFIHALHSGPDTLLSF